MTFSKYFSVSEYPKIAIIFSFVVLFLIPLKADADNAAWQTSTVLYYSTCQAPVSSKQTCVYSNYVWVGGEGGSLVPTVTTCTDIPLTPGYIWVDVSYMSGTGQDATLVPSWQQCLISSAVYTGSFTATDGVSGSKYAPSATVNVSLTGHTDLVGGGCGMIGPCQSAPGVGVAAGYGSFNLSESTNAACGGSGNAACSGSFTAPATPGYYAINLSGCAVNSSDCGSSALTIQVVNPPAVNIGLGFLNKFKSSLEKFFSLAERKKTLDKAFVEMMQ